MAGLDRTLPRYGTDCVATALSDGLDGFRLSGVDIVRHGRGCWDWQSILAQTLQM